MKKVLVVEDDPAIQTGLRELLISEEFDVISTSDGSEGEKLALIETPDLILLDINLPNLSGLEVCKRLREKNFNNPICMLTSRGEHLDKVIGLEMGADDYITKPFNNREIISRIRAHIRRTERSGNYIETIHGGSQRKLLTIFFSDMVGYSKSMNTNEKLTIQLLQQHNDIMRRIISEFKGCIVEIIGDAVLASFESAVEAVECSAEIQKQLSEYNSNKKKNEKIIIRIGIHLGDVVVMDDHLKGDTINIAARIQQNAASGKIFISEQVYCTVRNKTPLKFQHLGQFTFKNISEPVVLYSIKF